MHRALMQFFKPENYAMVREALLLAGRRDLIGDSPDALIGATPPREAASDGRRRGGRRPAKRSGGYRPGRASSSRRERRRKPPRKTTGDTDRRRSISLTGELCVGLAPARHSC